MIVRVRKVRVVVASVTCVLVTLTGIVTVVVTGTVCVVRLVVTDVDVVEVEIVVVVELVSVVTLVDVTVVLNVLVVFVTLVDVTVAVVVCVLVAVPGTVVVTTAVDVDVIVRQSPGRMSQNVDVGSAFGETAAAPPVPPTMRKASTIAGTRIAAIPARVTAVRIIPSRCREPDQGGPEARCFR